MMTCQNVLACLDGKISDESSAGIVLGIVAGLYAGPNYWPDTSIGAHMDVNCQASVQTLKCV